MVEAAESTPDTDPDRCSFTVALQAARDQVVRAADVLVTGTAPPLGRSVLAAVLPSRRRRASTLKAKSPISRYNERFDDLDFRCSDLPSGG